MQQTDRNDRDRQMEDALGHLEAPLLAVEHAAAPLAVVERRQLRATVGRAELVARLEDVISAARVAKRELRRAGWPLDDPDEAVAIEQHVERNGVLDELVALERRNRPVVERFLAMIDHTGQPRPDVDRGEYERVREAVRQVDAEEKELNARLRGLGAEMAAAR